VDIFWLSSVGNRRAVPEADLQARSVFHAYVALTVVSLCDFTINGLVPDVVELTR
jgi:hypothetical protein